MDSALPRVGTWLEQGVLDSQEPHTLLLTVPVRCRHEAQSWGVLACGRPGP